LSQEGFLTRNIAGLTSALESVLVNEELARKRGPAQSLDPRVKLFTLVLLVVIIGLARSIWVLAAIFILVLIMNFAGRIPLKFFLKRVVLFLPLTAIIVLPALFITPGEPLWTLGARVIITAQGARTAALLLLRVMDSVSLGVLLILTTPWNRILLALRWFRLPPVLVDILGMTYRYIFLLLHIANATFLARRSRSPGTLSTGENRRWLARTLATTMSRTQHLGEEVYLAMLARGYQGEIFSLNRLRLVNRDYIWLGCIILIGTALMWTIYR
jgi:cobalt/nickel transport system permease protein